MIIPAGAVLRCLDKPYRFIIKKYALILITPIRGGAS